ncbi:MAG: hypothetical protein MHPSP_004414, partial [Paramarteilia canceri]
MKSSISHAKSNHNFYIRKHQQRIQTKKRQQMKLFKKKIAKLDPETALSNLIVKN